MRRDADNPEIWRVAPLPAVIRSDGWRPFQSLSLPEVGGAQDGAAGTRCVFWLSGGTLGVSVGRSASLSGEVTAVGVLTGEPLAFARAGAGVVRVAMRHSSPVYLTYDSAGRFTLRGPMPVPAPMAFSAEGSTLLSEQVGVVALTGQGLQGGALSGADLRIVSKAFADTYVRLRERAAEAGLYIHPVLARYRLEDEHGDTLFQSPPVLVSGAQGFQCTQPVVQAFSGVGSLSGGALQARGYVVRLEAPAQTLPEPWSGMVRRAVVEVSDEIDPVEAGGLCTASVIADGASMALSVTLPGGGVRSAQIRSALVESALRRNLGRMRVVSVIDRPFSQWSGAHKVAPAPEVAGVEPSAVSCGLSPWRDAVSYGVTGSCAGLFCGGAPRCEGFAGYSPSQFVLTRGAAGSWQAVASVTLRRGSGAVETAVATAYGSGAVPVGFSPVLSYPDPDATALRLSVRDAGGAVRTRVFPLVSWPEGGISYYVAPGGVTLQQLDASEGILEVPAPTVTGRVEQGVVVVAPELRPGSVLCRADVGCGSIVAVTDAPRAAGSWDFSRRRLLACGDGGTALLTLDGKMALHSMSRLDLRGVTALSPATGAKGEVRIALAGGSLVETGASGVRTLLRRAGGATGVAYDSVHDEYLLAGGGTLPRRLDSRGEIAEVLADGIGSDAALITWEGRALMASGGLLCDCGLPDGDAAGDADVRCAFTERYESDRQPVMGAELLELTLPLIAGRASGAITVSADNGSGSGAPLVTLSVSGALRSPLRVRVPAPRRGWFEIAFRGYLSADASWGVPSMARAVAR